MGNYDETEEQELGEMKAGDRFEEGKQVGAVGELKALQRFILENRGTWHETKLHNVIVYIEGRLNTLLGARELVGKGLEK